MQIARQPKARRIPLGTGVPFTHRASVLLFNGGETRIENDPIDALSRMQAWFEKLVAFAIFILGTAPRRNLFPGDDQPGEKSPTPSAEPQDHDIRKEARPMDPAYAEISFLGLREADCPKCVQNTLRRMHCNLGHPPTASFVRHLAQELASQTALLAARALRCAICERLRRPREACPSKMFVARRLNDRVTLDILIHNIFTVAHSFLSFVHDATAYHVVHRQTSWPRSLRRGVCPPDELLFDGKGERHGGATTWIVSKVIDEFATDELQQLDLIGVMATSAKNVLTRRSGSSPAQWVFGRNPKLPAGLLSDPEGIDAHDELPQSENLQLIERVRHAAMCRFHDFECNSKLRAAMLRQSRPWRRHFEMGQRVAAWRNTSMPPAGSTTAARRRTLPGRYVLGTIVGIEPNINGNVWLKLDRTNRVVYVRREQLTAAEGQEAWTPSDEGLAALRSVEEGLHSGAVPYDDLQVPGPNTDDEVLPEPRLFVVPSSQPERPIIRPAGSIRQQVEPDRHRGLPARFPTVEEEEPRAMDDQEEARMRAVEDNEVDPVANQPTATSGSSNDVRPVSLDEPKHMPPSPSLSTRSPTKRAKPLLASSLPPEEVLVHAVSKGRGLTPWKQDIILIREAATAFQTGVSLVADKRPVVRSTAVRRDDHRRCELHFEGLSSENFELPAGTSDVLELTHSATIFHAPALATQPRVAGARLETAEGTWRTQAARSQVWRSSGRDEPLVPTNVGFTTFFTQVADPENQTAPRRRASRVDDEKNLWLESSDDDEPTGNDGSISLSRAERRALQRELPWRSISPDDHDAFIGATHREWAEWTRWSSLRRVRASEVVKVPPGLDRPEPDLLSVEARGKHRAEGEEPHRLARLHGPPLALAGPRQAPSSSGSAPCASFRR